MPDNQPRSIKKNTSVLPSLDFLFLREKGITAVQQLSGGVWTDYNLHDPGVTILEQLCYTITELAYRTEFPLEDILSDANGNIDLEDNAFFPKDWILSSNPVTIKDYRKLIIDQVEEIQNVWLESLNTHADYHTVQGLYVVIIQIKSTIASRFEREPGLEELIKQKVFSFLCGHRNLCEDFAEIIVLKPEKIRVEADVTIKDDAQTELLLARIYTELDKYLNPSVRYFTEKDQLAKGYTIEDIYTGPLLSKGIIPDTELKPRRFQIDISEISKTIADIPGVLYVKSVSVSGPDKFTAASSYLLDSYKFPLLDTGEETTADSSIRLFRDSVRLPVRKAIFRNVLQEMREMAYRGYITSFHESASGRSEKPGTYRNTEAYYSLQHNFPINYSLGYNSVPRNADKATKAQVKQLKAYLMLFEQVLANYLSQLSHIGRLFSVNIDTQNEFSYFTQPLYNVPGAAAILKDFNDTAAEDEREKQDRWNAFVADTMNGYVEKLKNIIESPAIYTDRKNRALDHLLARFNEQISDYLATTYEACYGASAGKVNALAHWKSNMLKGYTAMSYNRSKAFNFQADTWEEVNLSGLEQKIAAMTGLDNYRSRRLADVFKSDRSSLDTASASQPVFRTVRKIHWHQEDMEIIDTLPAGIANTGAVPFAFRSQTYKGFLSVLRNGISQKNYRIVPAGTGSEMLLIYKHPDEDQWHTISRYADKASAGDALARLTDHLRHISLQSEGFHIVEHILLRPRLDSSRFGFRLYGCHGDLLLQQLQWQSYSQRNETIAAIQLAGRAETNYAVKEETGHFSVQLLDSRKNILALLPQPYATHDEAIHAIKHTAHDVTHYQQRGHSFYPKFEMLVQLPGGAEIEEDFFSFNMSVILPSWPARFQDDNFKLYLQELFTDNAPAHIHIRFLWLKPSQMKRFETLFASWLDTLKRNSADRQARASDMTEYLLSQMR